MLEKFGVQFCEVIIITELGEDVGISVPVSEKLQVRYCDRETCCPLFPRVFCVDNRSTANAQNGLERHRNKTCHNSTLEEKLHTTYFIYHKCIAHPTIIKPF
jgi:hypothetical protein